MSDKILYPTADTFEELVVKSEKLTIVDFWATWCGPCKMLLPIIDQLADEMADKVLFAKVNVDEQEELAMKFRVETIPTLLFFKDGNIVGKSIGFRQKVQLLDMIKKAEEGESF